MIRFIMGQRTHTVAEKSSITARRFWVEFWIQPDTLKHAKSTEGRTPQQPSSGTNKALQCVCVCVHMNAQACVALLTRLVGGGTSRRVADVIKPNEVISHSGGGRGGGLRACVCVCVCVRSCPCLHVTHSHQASVLQGCCIVNLWVHTTQPKQLRLILLGELPWPAHLLVLGILVLSHLSFSKTPHH